MNWRRIIGLLLALTYLASAAWLTWLAIENIRQYHEFNREHLRAFVGYCLPALCASVLALKGSLLVSFGIAISAAVITAAAMMPQIY